VLSLLANVKDHDPRTRVVPQALQQTFKHVPVHLPSVYVQTAV